MNFELSIQEMMERGAHFGHQTRRWNPKMKPYLYGTRSGIHIIDLQKTWPMAQKALQVLQGVAASGEQVMFVGTKMQAQKPIQDAALSVGMPYVNRRWLGGMLTNFQTIRKSVDRLIELETKREKNEFVGYTKKEKLDFDREIIKLEASLGGVKNMNRLPGAIFVVDPSIEDIAIHEANVLGIPLVALVDSNCDPDPVAYPIPSNDDSQRCIELFCQKIAEACARGVELYKSSAQSEARSDAASAKKRSPRRAEDVDGAGRAYTNQRPKTAKNKGTRGGVKTEVAAPSESGTEVEAYASATAVTDDMEAPKVSSAS